MKKLYTLIAALLISGASSNVFANTMVKVKALGASPKGQYVAIEEFGYKESRKRPYSRIRVMNVWKNRYVGNPINVSSDDDDMKLDQVRAEAKKLAKKNLKKFNIST